MTGEQLDLAEVEDAYQVVFPEVAALGKSGKRLADAIPRLLAELREARAELDDWRNREHEQQYVLTSPGGDPNDADLVSQQAADLALERPDLGTPWVRTVTRSEWGRYTAAPADEPTPEALRLRQAFRAAGEAIYGAGCGCCVMPCSCAADAAAFAAAMAEEAGDLDG